MPMPNYETEIARLYTTTLQLGPDETSLGMQIRQGPDDAPEVLLIKPSSPSSRSQLEPGHRILGVNGHRIRSAQEASKCFRHYLAKGLPIKLLVSGGALPPGCAYALVKVDNEQPMMTTLEDGSLQGLFLKEDGGKGGVRVESIGSNGLFTKVKINKKDVIMAMNGIEVNSIKDCEDAMMQNELLGGDLIPTLTYNVFRKAKSTLVVETTSNSAVEGNSLKTKKRVISDVYEMGEELGSGAFSTVVLATSKDTGEKFAVKIVNRSSLDAMTEKSLRREINILSGFNHPNILRLIETYTTIQRHYLVTEILEGGELFDRIVKKTVYTEGEARDLSKTLIETMEYCHLRQVAHRDLKPENILLKSLVDDTQITIADFGLARKAPDDDSLQTFCGSPMYLSPEIIKRSRYGTQTDMWSLGVIIFILLGGYPPFSDDDRKIQDKLIARGKYQFFEDYWDEVSGSAQKLIKSLLVVDPKKRLSATDALNHRWFAKERTAIARKTLKSQDSIASNFVHGKFHSAVKKVIMSNIISSLTLGPEGLAARRSTCKESIAAMAGIIEDEEEEDEDDVPHMNETSVEKAPKLQVSSSIMGKRFESGYAI